MSNNIGLPSADKGTLQLNLNYDWNNLETLKQGANVLDDNTRQRETHSFLLEAGYTLSSSWSLDVFVPFIRQERTITTTGTPNFSFTQGIGDIVILPKYQLGEKITIGLGVKIPTGSSSKRINGIALSADLQPGSGALDGLFFGAYKNYSIQRPSFGYFGNIIFRLTGTNSSYLGNARYEFGNELQLIGGISDRFRMGSFLFDPSLKIRYRIADRDFFNDTKFPASGGQFFFINPGISVVLNQKLSWQVNVSIPVYSNVNDTQLSPSLQLNTGFAFRTNLLSPTPF